MGVGVCERSTVVLETTLDRPAGYVDPGYTLSLGGGGAGPRPDLSVCLLSAHACLCM